MKTDIFLEGTERDRPALAALLILSALAVLSLQDALVKLVSDTTSLWQFQILRAMMNIGVIFLLLIGIRRLDLLRPRETGWVALRSGVMVCTMILFFAGAPFLTLAEMGAGLYTYPVFMALLGWMFLGERVGPLRVLAMLLAVSGALLIIQPGAEGFSLEQLLPVGAGFFYAINSLILRRHCREESPVTMAAWTAMAFLLVCSVIALTLVRIPLSEATRAIWPFLLAAWPTLTGMVLGLAALASLCNLLGNVLIVKGYQSAELSWFAPIDYSYLVMAMIWGLVLFSDVPGQVAVLGIALIIAAGVLTAWNREQSGEG